MVNERMTALEVRVDGMPALEARLAATEAALRAYKDAVPRPSAYYAVLEEQPEALAAPRAARLAAARRDVLAAVASALPNGAQDAHVRCFLARRLHEGPVFVVLVSNVNRMLYQLHDPGEMFTALSRCGARVVQWHAIMTDIEEQYFAHCMADNELLIPVRAMNVEGLPARAHVAADEALGWCRWLRGEDFFEVAGACEAWAQLTNFQLFIHNKHVKESADEDV
jgi:hypothetical protein